jgi:hypothetical protein
MKKASEYRQHAEECRVLARRMAPGEHRDQLLEMAATWDNLATERSELVRRHPELAIGAEHEEELRQLKKELRQGLRMVLRERIELSTSPLPRECSTTELPQRAGSAGPR